MASGVDLIEVRPAAAPAVVATGRNALRLYAPIAIAMVIYLALALAIARTKVPWCDEGWFANPSYNLAMHGQMSTNVLEPSGHYLNAYLRGIQQRTYVVPPNHLVAMAAWFRLVGFSVFKMRVYSILWGALTFPVLFYIVYKLLEDVRVASLAVLFTSIDFIFLWATADGRMEATASTLALCGIAAYLHYRENNFRTAVIASQIFGAAAAFTHPNALLGVIAVLALAWRFDRGRLKWSHALLAAAPYVAFAAAWSVYIFQAPLDWRAQFFANAAGRNSTRWKVILQPWLALWWELYHHLSAYVGLRMWSAAPNDWMLLIPPAYIAALAWFLCTRRILRTQGVRMFATCVLAYLLGLTFLNGFKACNYMMYLLPFYNAIFAYWLIALWRSGAPQRRLVSASLLVGFVGIQVSTTVQHVRADEYHREYLPATRYLRQARGAGKEIMASSLLGFGMDFTSFRDDTRLGIYSGRAPDILVMDRSYRYFMFVFARQEPRVFTYAIDTLTSRYRLTAAYGQFWMFERREHEIPARSRAAMEAISKWNEESQKTDCLFELLRSSPEALELGVKATL